MKKVDLTKKYEVFLKEYISKISDEELKYLYLRLHQRLSGDLAQLLEFFEKVPEIDKMLGSTANADELFDTIDILAKMFEKEYDRRSEIRNDKK